MRIDPTIGLRIASQIRELSQTYAKSLQRLSAGKRILSPRDGPAEFSLATGLSSKIRKLSRGIQNANAALGLTRTAEAGLNSQLDLLNRMKEITIEGRNETLSSSQRAALEQELQSLMQEYRRVTLDTEFNGQKLLTGDKTWSFDVGGSTVSVETFGTRTSDVFEKKVGTGTYTLKQTGTVGGFFFTYGAEVGDVNGDGKADMISSDWGDSQITVLLGKGDGTFLKSRTYEAAFQTNPVKIADLNNDGKKDLISIDYSTATFSIWMGNGDGTFANRVTIASPGINGYDFTLGDADRDGDIDIIGDNGGLGIYFNNGSGTFGPRQTVGAALVGESYQFGDVTGDGISDVVMGSFSFGGAYIYAGNGDGSFQTPYVANAGWGGNIANLRLVDFDNDGDLDMSGSANNTHTFLRNDGSGTFTITQQTSHTWIHSSEFADINRDGIVDWVTNDGSAGITYIYLGNGNGTFTQSRSMSMGIYAKPVDLNGDGIIDLAGQAPGGSSFASYLGNSTTVNREGEMSVRNSFSAGASLEILDNAIDNVIRSQNSWARASERLDLTNSYNQRMLEVTESALSNVEDLDIANETATLVATQIRLQAQTALISHANFQLELVLRLLYSK